MKKLKYTLKTDTLFKLLFTKYPHLLKRLVAHLLRIPFSNITHFVIKNTEMPPEIVGNKFCHLDIHMAVNGQQVSLEVQVEDEGNFAIRAEYMWARLFSNALPSGSDYINLPRTIVISILDFTLFEESDDFYSEFQTLEVKRHTPLSDKKSLHFFELTKLPTTIDKNDLLVLWLALFKANTEEELKKIAEMGVPELSEAVTAYHNVAASPEFQELERMRDKARHDEASALRNARRKAEKKKAIKMAKLMLADGEPIAKIIRYTGLSQKEVENLQNAK